MRSLVVVLCSAFLLVATAVRAQTSPPTPAQPAEIHGVVLDQTGAPLPGARIALIVGRRTLLAVETDARGEFQLTAPTAVYVLKVEANGFEPWRGRITIRESNAPETIVLDVAAVRESVSVAAAPSTATATKTPALVRDVPQSIAIVNKEMIRDQLMASIAEVVQYVPGISAHQGENNRDDVVIRGNRSSADFFINGVRDDVQYYRDLYNVERVEALRGPNALIFGRGGAGGVVNRVTKEPQFSPLRAVALQGGSFGNRRATLDLDQPFGTSVALRVNGMIERSDSFRRGVEVNREAVNPTLSVSLGNRTRLTAGYEFLRDRRIADRGVTSIDGRPAVVHPSTYYGDPDQSAVRAEARIASALLEHRVGHVVARNRTLVADYDRFYQNFVPGAVTPDHSLVALTAYNNASQRRNVFNQTDIVTSFQTGQVRHSLLTGLEFGHQQTANFRRTGFFNDSATTIRVPFDDPVTKAPVTFRQSATDADNHVEATVAAAFAQDEAALSRHLTLLAGIRFDRFDLHFENRRNGDVLERSDNLVSPRAGLVFKPADPVSIFASYSVSHLPSSGDQFASLTSVTQQLKPERFDNYEVGVKWDTARGLSVSTSIYRLDRSNTRSTDPNDPTRIVQTGSQRTNGAEFGLSGEVFRGWRVSGGYAYQDAKVTSATAAARAGAKVGQVPHHSFSLWNQYRVTRRVSAAVGILHRSVSFATIDNTVILPEHTRADAAAYFDVTSKVRLQANIENLFDARYFQNADSNTNISPGSPRALRLALTARF